MNEHKSRFWVIAVVGSRDYPDMAAVRNYVRSLPQVLGDGRDILVLSGGARGVDTIAVITATEYGLPTSVIRAEWEIYGRSAGMHRNRLIAQDCDELVAFWDGGSIGTKNILSVMKTYWPGKLVTIITPDGITAVDNRP